MSKTFIGLNDDMPRDTLRRILEALSLLDDIATSRYMMGWEDIDALCEARRIIAVEVGATYNPEVNRYE